MLLLSAGKNTKFRNPSHHLNCENWWTDTEGSLAAAVEEMRPGYDELMKPVIDNIPMLIVAILLTIPVAILAMRFAERALKNQTALLKQ